MSNLEDIADRPLLEIWGDAVRTRRVQGDRITLAVVELAPNAVVPGHVHENEQVGICLEGSGTFTIGDEARDIRPGMTWRILSMVPHELVVGPDGAVVIDVFNPPRSDWDDKVVVEPAPAPRWPKA
jgi:quercetin dioxygenase-like cupin family protein